MRIPGFVVAMAVSLLLIGCAARPPMAHEALAPGLHHRSVSLEWRGTRDTYPYALYVPAGTPPHEVWPVVLFLHGSGERGSDGEKQTKVGLYPAVQKNPEHWPCVIVMPQLPTEDPDPKAFYMRWRHRGDLALAALDDALAPATGSHGDAKHVALTGLSNGGQGSWQLAADHPNRFTRVLVISGASIVPVLDGAGQPIPMLLNGKPLLSPLPTREEQRRSIASLARQDVWAVHGLADPVVPPAHCETMVGAMRSAGGTRVRVDYLPGVDHNAWDATYGREDVARWLVGR